MFDLVLTLCLAADPGTCRTATADAPPAALRACLATGADRAAARAGETGEILGGWRCVRAPERSAEPLAMTEIAPGVFVHEGHHAEPDAANEGDISNMGFVVGERAVAVIDAGGSGRVAARMLASIRRETDLPVEHLILTHMHPDHVFGATVFAEAGATVIGHRRLAPALRARAGTYRESIAALMGAAAFAGSGIVLPSVAVAGTTEIDLGGRTLRLEAHPTAHTDNDLTVLDTATGTWFLGDLLFVGHTPAIDGSLTGWLAVLEGLRGRAAARAVPGHGPASLPWPAGSDPLHGYLSAIATETRAAIAAGLTLSEAVETVGWEAREDWDLFDLFHPRNVTTAFQELEWE